MITDNGIKDALTAQNFHNHSLRADEAGWAVQTTSQNAYRFEFHVYRSGQIEVRVMHNVLQRGQHSLYAADHVRLSAALTAIAAL